MLYKDDWEEAKKRIEAWWNNEIIDRPCIQKLNGIQWVPGEGNGQMIRWLPLLKKIQNTGKILHLSVKAEEIIPLLKELSPKGIMFSTSVEKEEDAKALISSLYKKQ